MMLWLALAAMTVVAVVIVIFPLIFRPRSPAESASEIAFYSAQLAEIARVVDRGPLPSDEASAARAETGRKLLAARALADDAKAPKGAASWFRRFATVLIALVVPTIGISLYGLFGQPALADSPLSSRADATPEPDPVAEALARIEADVAASPDNEKAWSALAPAYIRLGRYSDAIKANRNLLRLKGEDGTLRANLGEAEVAEAGGKVTTEARVDFEQALADSPDSVMARFYLGLAAEQAGDKKKALEAYEPLLDAAKDHPHWLEIIQTRLAALKGAKAPDASEPPASAAAENAGVPESQKAMVNAMVAKLTTRLAQSGGSADEWMRLVRSYVVLDDKDKAREALGSARKALSADATAGAKFDALEQELNQTKTTDASAPPPEASAAPAPAATTNAGIPNSQREMVNAMVAKLATRVAQSGGSVDDWIQLIRSYAVLDDKDKATDALGSARKALSADATAGAKLDSLAQELNLAQP